MTVSSGTVLKVVATLVWDTGGVNQNVFNAVVTGGGAPWDDEDIVDDALDWVSEMYTPYQPSMHPDCEGSQVAVYKHDPIGQDWDEVGTAAWNFIPNGPGDALPRGCAALINAKTVDPDVSGKKYLPAGLEDRQAEGLIGAIWLEDLADFADQWVGEFVGLVSGADWVPGVWSVVNTTHYAMTGEYIIPTISAYQRRRKQGVGI